MLIGHAVQMQGTVPELVERETVLATLRHLLGSLSRRRGHTVLVTGPTASGRSALLRAFAEEAAAAGASVLTSAGSPAESRLPFELVNQLLPGLRPTDGAAEHPMPAQPAGTSGADAAREVHRSVARLARTAPVVLVVDDVQHGDRESLDCLLYAVRRLERAPVMIVVSEPEQPVPGVPSVSSALLPHRRCTRLRVGPLSVDGIRTLATHRVGAVEARRLAPRLKLLTGGNPLLVHALLDDGGGCGEVDRAGAGDECGDGDGAAGRAGTGETAGPGEGCAGTRFHDAVLTCLDRCGPGAADVARALALIDTPATAQLIGEITRMTPESVGQAVTALRTSGVIENFRFRHPGARSAVLASVPYERHRALRLRVAELLHRRGARPAEVARHLLRCGEVGAPWACQVLESAAEAAMADDDIDHAVNCLRHAHLSAVDTVRRTTSRIKMVQAEWCRDPEPSQRHLKDLIGQVRQGGVAEEALPSLVKQMIWHGIPGIAEELLDRLRLDTGAVCPSEAAERQFTHLWAASVYPSLLRTVPQTPVGRRRDSGPLRAAGALLDVLKPGGHDAAVADADQLLETVYPAGREREVFRVAVLALETLLYAGRAERAARWSERLLDSSGDSPPTSCSARRPSPGTGCPRRTPAGCS